MYGRWFLRARYLVGLTPVRARELVAECFYELEGNVYRQSQRQQGHAPSDEEIREMVDGTIRGAFLETGHDYDNPTKEALKDVVNILMRKAVAWKTPQELIMHHREELGRLIARLP